MKLLVVEQKQGGGTDDPYDMCNPVLYRGNLVFIDPLPVLILSHPLEVIGRLSFVVWYNFWMRPCVMELTLRVERVRGLIFYMQLIGEAEIMSVTPLGGFPEDDE